MNGTIISVVIPCYNQAHFLAEAIDSVLAQTHVPREIIVVDDGSTDETAELAARYSQVRLVQQSNRGLAAARNRGLDASRGDYVTFLDADDRLMTNALSDGLACLAQHPECAFAWGRYLIRNARNEVWEPGSDANPHEDAYAALLHGNHIGMHAAVLYRRDALKKIGGFDARLPVCEDYELYLRIARRFPIVKHGHIVAEYRKHGNNMSVDSPTMLTTVLDVLEAQQGYVDEHPMYRTAHARGVRFWKQFYGVRSLGKIARELFALEFGAAINDATSLARSVGTFAVLLNAPVWLVRHWVTGRARDSKR